MPKVDTNLLTQAEYAQWRSERGLPGGTRAAVGKAVATGRIKAHGERKLIDAAQADAQWARNTRFKVDLEPTGPIAKLQKSAQATPLKLTPPRPGVFSDPIPMLAESDSLEDGDLMHHRTREMAAKATLLEMEVAEKARSLTSADEVRRNTMSAWRFLRDMLQTFGRQTAPKLAHVTDAHEVQSIIDSEMRAVLHTFGERTLPGLLKSHDEAPVAAGVQGAGVPGV